MRDKAGIEPSYSDAKNTIFPAASPTIITHSQIPEGLICFW